MSFFYHLYDRVSIYFSVRVNRHSKLLIVIRSLYVIEKVHITEANNTSYCMEANTVPFEKCLYAFFSLFYVVCEKQLLINYITRKLKNKWIINHVRKYIVCCPLAVIESIIFFCLYFIQIYLTASFTISQSKNICMNTRKNHAHVHIYIYI
jgi:hypothetical protein